MGNLLRGVILIPLLLKQWVNDMQSMLPLKVVSLFLKELFYSLSWNESLCWPITKAHHTVTFKVPSRTVCCFVTGPTSKPFMTPLWKGCARFLEFQAVTSMEREWQHITQSGKVAEKRLLSTEIILTFAVFITFTTSILWHFSVYYDWKGQKASAYKMQHSQRDKGPNFGKFSESSSANCICQSSMITEVLLCAYNRDLSASADVFHLCTHSFKIKSVWTYG